VCDAGEQMRFDECEGGPEATLNDPPFQTAWDKIDPDSPVASQAELEKLVHALGSTPPQAVEYIQAELKRQGFGLGSR
jgi:hypothetical protein